MPISLSRLVNKLRTPTCARVAQPPTQLRLEQLESREVPSISILLDYSYDTSGFFNDPNRRAVLQKAVDEVAVRIDQPLGDLTSTGGNTWKATFYNPSTG